MSNEEKYDVVIAGAGMSGLSAADFIKQDNQVRLAEGKRRLSYLILEGSGRAGGRTLTDPTAPGFLDVGGAYIAPTQSYVGMLIERFQLSTFRTWLPDETLSIYEPAAGDVRRFPEPNYPITPGVASIIGTIENAILPIRAHLERPWETYRAAELDRLSAQAWMDQNIVLGRADGLTDADKLFSRELLTIAIRSAFSVEPREISWFYFLYYGATCGTLRAFEDVKGGGDSIRFAKGTQELVTCLVNEVGPANIRYGSDILNIAQDDSGATLTYRDSKGTERQVSAEQVIIALSPGATKYIAFSPSLSEERQGLVNGAPMAATIKGFLRFETKWWRPKYTGYVLSAGGPADWMLDNTWLDQDDKQEATKEYDGTWKYPALMTFIVGDKARALNETTTADQRRAMLLDQVYRLFEGNPDDYPCIDYREKNWLADEWSHGCPAGCLQPNVLTLYGSALRTPEGRLHWAGSESATDWMGGYMNGAIQAGIRAASEVLKLF